MDIQVLHRQGMSIKAISRELRISRNTVRKCLRTDQVPQYRACTTRRRKLDSFRAYPQARVAAAHPSWIRSTVLFDEIRPLGYTGGRSILAARRQPGTSKRRSGRSIARAAAARAATNRPFVDWRDQRSSS